MSTRIGQVLHPTVPRWMAGLAVAAMLVGVGPSVTAEARSEVSQSASVTIDLESQAYRLVEVCFADGCETLVLPPGATDLTLALDYTVVDRSRLPRVDLAGGTPHACTVAGPSGSAVARPGAAIEVSSALLGTSPSVRVSASGHPVTKVGKKGKPQGETTDAVGARLCLG